MYIFFKSMAYFWTLVELIILLSLRWGFLFFNKRSGSQNIYLVFSIAVFILLGLLLFWGESFFGSFLEFKAGYNLKLYRWALWNFFCTTWVVLEGGFVIYAYRIYRSLRPAFCSSNSSKTIKLLSGRLLDYSFPILIFFAFAFFAYYEYQLVSMVGPYRFGTIEINRISQFYIRICGLFWILFEGIVAIIVMKAYFNFKELTMR